MCHHHPHRYTEATAKVDIDVPEFDFVRNCIARLCPATPAPPHSAASPSRQAKGGGIRDIGVGRFVYATVLWQRDLMRPNDLVFLF